MEPSAQRTCCRHAKLRDVAVACVLFLVSNGALAARLALVVGNDKYRQIEPLQTARADASAMAKALADLGFAVTLRLDADDRALNAAVRLFKSQLSGGDEAVFFFAGHGVQLGAENFLIPVDVGLGDVDQIKDESLSLQRVLDDLQEKKPRFSLVIVDACRNNPFRTQLRAAATRGLVPVSTATGQMVIYSAGAGQTAIDRLGVQDRDPNGLFTRVFLREMKMPGVSVDRVLRRVRDDVVAQARGVGHEQVPAIYDQAIGDFYFIPPQAAASRPQTATPAPVAAPVPAPIAAPLPAAAAPAAPERTAAIETSARRPGAARLLEMRKPVFAVGDSWVMREFDLVTQVDQGRIAHAVHEASDAEYWLYTDRGGAKSWSRGDHRTLAELERFQFEPSAPGQRGRSIERVKQPDAVPWPIKVGDTWRQKIAFVFPGGETGHLDLSYVVEANEDVKTPAGTFESFKVRGKGYWYSDIRRNLGLSEPVSRGRAEVTTWYAAAAKREVRSEVRTWNPVTGNFDIVLGRELVSLSLTAPGGSVTKQE